jgi:hypothetical protein
MSDTITKIKLTVKFTRSIEIEVPMGITDEDAIKTAANELNGEIERGEFFVSDMDAEIE